MEFRYLPHTPDLREQGHAFQLEGAVKKRK
jgi:hypothetical protein